MIENVPVFPDGAFVDWLELLLVGLYYDRKLWRLREYV
jgi:hypothetical protein